MNRILKSGQRLRADWQERIGLAITGAIGVVLSTGVIAALIYLLLALGSLMSASDVYAQAAPPAAGVMLQAGIEKENVDGDLKAAMGIYEKIAADASAPREVRAKALLRLAGCDEKLGKQAKQVYEQILHDYADQPAAAQARTRLATIKQREHPSAPATMTARRIEWTKLGEMGVTDTDGERATFIGPDRNLFFGDLAGHNRNLIYRVEEPRFLNRPGWLATRDFSMVALDLLPSANLPFILAVIKMDGTGYRELIRDDQGRIFGPSLLSVDTNWSWDNRYLAITFTPLKEGGRLIVVDVRTGSYRELARSASDCLGAVRFAPDGRFIAYEATPITPNSGTNRVYVVPVQGGKPYLAKEGPQQDTGKFYVLKDWTADGRYLITKEVGQGKPALYLLPMKDGVTAGPGDFVRFGDFDDAHTTLSGALVYQDRAATSTDVDAYLASIDSSGQIGGWRTLDLRGGVKGKLGFPWPSFSPDGSRIAYRAGASDPKLTDLIILDLSTGQQRVIYQSLDGMLTCQYSSKAPKVFCALTGRDGGDSTDLVSVDDQTGAVEKIASLPGSKGMTHYPDDGRTFYFFDVADKAFEVTRWDMETKQETVVVPGPQNDGFQSPSFDGRWLLRSVPGDGMSVRPMSGGDWKMLVSGVKGFDSMNDTTHDGNWAFYSAYDSSGKPGLFRVPITGGAPERVGDLPSPFFRGKFYLSTDGRQILGGNLDPQRYDLWVLENFEPPVKK